MIDVTEVGERGYLKEDFRLVHLRDENMLQLEYHYHVFDKLVLMLSGGVEYSVEGRTYDLREGDVLLVGRNMIHRPNPKPGVPYERVVLWLSPDFLERQKTGGSDLGQCFRIARETNSCLLADDGETALRARSVISEAEAAMKGGGFGSELLVRSLILQLLVAVNRGVMKSGASNRPVRGDAKIDEIMSYINRNLPSDLSVDALAARFYLSRSHLMHRFRDVTGTTVHRYVTEKRLLLAYELLHEGCGVSESCASAGFSDYSAFSRTFRSTFGVCPRDAAKMLKLSEKK